MVTDRDRSHPLHRIELPAKGFDAIPRDVRNKFVFRRSFNSLRGDAHLMESFEAESMLRYTLREDIRVWLANNHEGHVSILAGLGLTWITLWSKRDALLFKVFYL